jgi:hypothetical protein
MISKQRVLMFAAIAAVTVGALALGTTAEAARPQAIATSFKVNQTDIHLGDSVEFSYSLSRNVRSPRIRLDCSQSGRVVFSADQAATTSFLLGGTAHYASEWLLSGGSADCRATLYDGNGSAALGATGFMAADRR